MLTDPVVLLRWSFGIAIACFVWLATFILFNDAVMRVIGDAAFALMFVSLVIGISAIIIAFMFRRHAAIRRRLVRGEGVLARWTVGPQDWLVFVRKVFPEIASNFRMTLGLIVFFAIVIPGGMALMIGKDYHIFAWIGLGIMLIGLLGHWLGTRQAKRNLTYRGGAVAFSNDGIIVNGAYQGWGIPGSKLAAVDYHDGSPGILKLTYSYWTKGGPQYVDVFAPVPAAVAASVEAALPKLRVSGEKPPKDEE